MTIYKNKSNFFFQTGGGGALGVPALGPPLINLPEENHPVEKLGILTHLHDRTAEIRDCVYLRVDVYTLCSHYGQSHRTNIIKLLKQKSRED